MLRRWWPWLVLVLIVASAVTVRAWRLDERNLEHWDEGVYTVFAERLARGDLSAESEAPFDPRYAPPLFPLLVSGSFLLFGLSAPSAIAVSVSVGAATVIVLFGLVRAIWGSAAGLASALFLAVCPYHVIYSRMALTDALYVFLLLAALWAYVRAIRTGRLWVYGLAGGLTGLCQNTKYHGFLAFALVGLFLAIGWIADLLRKPSERRAIARQVVGMTSAFSVLLVLYAPWAVIVELTMGYGTLLAHTGAHSGFWRTPLSTWSAYAALFTPASILLLGLFGAAVGLVVQRPQARLVVLAFGVFGLAPTFYTGYPRLLLPAVTLLCGLAGAALAWLFGLEVCRKERSPQWLRASLMALLAAMIALHMARETAPILQARPSGYPAAAAAVEQLPSDAPILMDVQWSMRFYLHRPLMRLGHEPDATALFRPSAVTRYLVTDVRVFSPRQRARMLPLLEALDRAGLRRTIIENPLGDVTLLNTLSLSELEQVRAIRTVQTPSPLQPFQTLGDVDRTERIVIYEIPPGWRTDTPGT